MHEHCFLVAHHNLPGSSKCEGPRQFSSDELDPPATNFVMGAHLDPEARDCSAADGQGWPCHMASQWNPCRTIDASLLQHRRGMQILGRLSGLL